MAESGDDCLNTTYKYGCQIQGCPAIYDDIYSATDHAQRFHNYFEEGPRVILEIGNIPTDFDHPSFQTQAKAVQKKPVEFSEADNNWSQSDVAEMISVPEETTGPQAEEEYPCSLPVIQSEKMMPSSSSWNKQYEETFQQLLGETPPSDRYNIKTTTPKVRWYYYFYKLT